MEWLNDKILFAFGRQDAPVVGLPALSAGEAIVLVTGTLPNRKGHPLIQKWCGIRFVRGAVREKLDLQAVMERTRFGRDEIPNPAAVRDFTMFQPLISPAVDAMREEMRAARRAFDEATRPELDRQLKRLSEFRQARSEQLELQFAKIAHLREAKQRKLGSLYEEYSQWIRDTLETEDQPSIRVAAIFTHV
jgi:hypothetical protein